MGEMNESLLLRQRRIATMTPVSRVIGLALLGLVLSLTLPAQAADSSEVVKIAAKADKIAADGTQVVTIIIDIDKGWHLYANPVGQDFLKTVQTAVTPSPSQKLEIVKVEYPKGEVKKDTDTGDYNIYEGKVTIKATVKREKDATDPVELVVKIQACSDKNCNLPSKVKVSAK